MQPYDCYRSLKYMLNLEFDLKLEVIDDLISGKLIHDFVFVFNSKHLA